MKKLLIVIFVILLLVIGGIIVYFFKFSENEQTLRNNIEDTYYNYHILGAKSNGYTGFNSREDAERATRCISKELSELVKKEDLKETLDKMKWSERPTFTLQRYLIDDIGYDSNGLEKTMKFCLDQNGYNSSIQQ
jgi:hypothetical protein